MGKKIKILLVNTSDKGGAAKACLRLQAGLLNLGIDAQLLLREQSEPLMASCILQPKRKSYIRRIKEKFLFFLQKIRILKSKKQLRLDFLSKRPKGLEYFSFPFSEYDITESPLYKQADIIHLHWVSDFLDWESFFKKNTKPLVWTLHDQAPFLGGEHYEEDFKGIDCNGYPVLRYYTTIEKAQSNNILNFKRKILSDINKIYFVANSVWLKECARKSMLMSRFDISHIYLGFPTLIFRPYDIFFCRQVFGIPSNKKVILFVADNIHNSRKGLIYLKLALEKISEKQKNKLFLFTIGASDNLGIENSNGLSLDKIVDERLLAMAYSASDVFIIPSLKESFGQTTIEAQLCGTPSIGFPTGGIMEAIQDGENGFLCTEISVNALSEKIVFFLDNDTKFDREKIAATAAQKYGLNIQATQYIELYKQILNY